MVVGHYHQDYANVWVAAHSIVLDIDIMNFHQRPIDTSYMIRIPSTLARPDEFRAGNSSQMQFVLTDYA